MGDIVGGWDSQAIDGVPPFGHTTHLRIFIDPDLLQYDEVWAAAGTWHDVFGIEPVRREPQRWNDLARQLLTYRPGSSSYAGEVDDVPTIEDSRGVDVSQIRRQLRMTAPERVQVMVEAANRMLAIQEHAQASIRQAR